LETHPPFTRLAVGRVVHLFDQSDRAFLSDLGEVLFEQIGIDLVLGWGVDAIHGEAGLSGQVKVIETVAQEMFGGLVLVVLVGLEEADAVETVRDEEDQIDQHPVRQPLDLEVAE